MARKAAPVEGVFERKRGSGIWYARYRQNGVDVRKSFGRNKGAAIDYFNKARLLSRTGEGVVPTTAKRPVLTAAEIAKVQDGVLLGELCDGLLKQIVADPDRYRDQYNPPKRIARVKKTFGTRVASSIRPYEIQDWLRSLKSPNGKGLSPGGRNRYKTVVSAIYTFGKEREKVIVNPAREFKREKESDGVIRWLDAEEETQLRDVLQADIDKCNSETQPVLRQRCLHRIYELDIALGTGVRRSEQYRMTWDAVNFNRPEVILPRTKFGPARAVYMIKDVVAAMHGLEKMSLIPREWKRGRPSKVPANCIFAIVENRTWFRSAVKRAGIKNFRWHDLRHTFCSRLVQKGVNLKIVQEAAGHRAIAMTARYAHLDKTSLADAMELLNREPTETEATSKEARKKKSRK